MIGHRPRRLFPFRIPPLFRIFYSVTYTALYLLLLLILAITPVSLLWTSIQKSALQYVFMIGGTYVLTLLLAVFIYSSRLYTNRAVLAAVGKAYIPVEQGEVSKRVRRMIVKQLERSAIIAWEGRPRDIYGEIVRAENEGVLPPESMSVMRDDYTVGTIIPVDPEHPHWGDIRHVGWSSPSHNRENANPNVQYANVIAELPHLIEARAVSFAPPDPTSTPIPDEPRPADPAVVSILQRPVNMALREYLTQIGYLGLVQPPTIGEEFLALYEKARFSAQPTSDVDFKKLMDTFARLLSGMSGLDPAIINEIRSQVDLPADLFPEVRDVTAPASTAVPEIAYLPELPRLRTTFTPTGSLGSASHSPVTARERFSRSITPYTQQDNGSEESIGSVITRRPEDSTTRSYPIAETRSFSSSDSSLMSNIPSDAGSVLWHDTEINSG